MNRRPTLIALPLLVLALAGCGKQPAESAGSGDPAPSSPAPTAQPERWYTSAQVERGDALFQSHCAECHKADASGTPDWRTPQADGKYPPPPLNGTAHTWHHPLSVLRRTVRIGGVRLGGTMPGFAGKLTAEQIDAILAWVQERWPDETYRIWHERNAQAERRKPSQQKG